MKSLDAMLVAAFGLALLALLLARGSKGASWIEGTSSGLAGWIKSVVGGR